MILLQKLIAFLIALGVLVVVHELGHYLAARLCGVRVLRFAVGFGKPLWRHRGKDGTEWVVAGIPLGGYVRMLDERDPEFPVAPHERHQAFNTQPVLNKMFIVIAGPMANFLLAIVLYAMLFASGVQEARPRFDGPVAGTMAARAGLQRGDEVIGVDGAEVAGYSQFRWQVLGGVIDQRDLRIKVRRADGLLDDLTLRFSESARPALDRDVMGELGLRLLPDAVFISAVTDDGAARDAGLLAGDQIVAIDGKRISRPDQVIDAIRKSAGELIDLEIIRDGRSQILPVTPKSETDPNGLVVGKIGAGLAPKFDMVSVQYDVVDALGRGWDKTWDTAALSLRIMGRMLTGDVSWRNLSGPVAIADYAGQSAKVGLEAYVAFIGMISISLGVLNLLPVPVLDGGHLLYHLAEAIRGAPLPTSVMELGQRIGVAMIVALTGVALFNDLSRLLG